MKNFSILFTLLITCSFTTFTNAQAAKTLSKANQHCGIEAIPTPIKTKTTIKPSKKSLATTKKRRLKSYQNNHKINRKRKAITLDHAIAAKE